MIRYTLRCDNAHPFESWFASSATYDKQARHGLVTCPICGSGKIEKAPMAPRIGKAKKSAPAVPASAGAPADAPSVPLVSAQDRELRAKLRALRDHLTSHAENVGKTFSEEARKMHYGEIEHRPIYGEAAPDEARALAEEGVEFLPLPVVHDERN